MSRRRKGMGIFSTPEHKTRILPLRWIVNWLNSPATACLVRAVELDEREDYGWRYKMYAFGWKYINKPYERWGTVYKLDLESWKKDLSDNENYYGDDDVK